MGKAKIAGRGRAQQQAERTPARRYLLISNETGMDITGTDPSRYPDKATRGIEGWERACDRAANLVTSVTIVPAWEYFGIPDPEADED